MVATNEYLVRIWEVAKPVQEVKDFMLASCHREIARMDNNVRFGQFMQAMMTAVCV